MGENHFFEDPEPSPVLGKTRAFRNSMDIKPAIILRAVLVSQILNPSEVTESVCHFRIPFLPGDTIQYVFPHFFKQCNFAMVVELASEHTHRLEPSKHGFINRAYSRAYPEDHLSRATVDVRH
jgi:hypothetical protein